MSAARVDAPILVGGIPRSGTSLMRDILGSHPDVAMFPSALPLWRVLAAGVSGEDLRRPETQARLVEALVSHPRAREAGVRLDARAILTALSGETGVTAGRVFAEALGQYARATGRPRWGIKDPGTEFHAEEILHELPHVRIVHMIRDPRDVLVSQRGMWGRRAQHIVSTVDTWRRSAALARRQTATRPDAYVAVRYEDLVADPPAIVRRVCDVVGLAYRAEMLELAARPAWWVVSSDPALGDRRDIFSAAVARHLRQLGPADACFIQLRAGREMARWGYPLRSFPLGARDRGRVALRLAEDVAWRLVRGRWTRRSGRGSERGGARDRPRA